MSLTQFEKTVQDQDAIREDQHIQLYLCNLIGYGQTSKSLAGNLNRHVRADDVNAELLPDQ